MFPKPLSLSVRKLLDLAGIHVRSARMARPLDRREAEWDHPLSLAHQSVARPILLTVPLSHCISFHCAAYPAAGGPDSPFLATARRLMKHPEMGFAGSPLDLYYQRVQPASVSERLGFPHGENPFLDSLPPGAAQFPWSVIPYAEAQALREQQLQADHAEHSRACRNVHGDSFFGPVSPEKGQVEIDRLRRMLDSFQTRGFIVDPAGFENITAVCLLRGDHWRFLLAGQHRTAAWAALGHSHIPIQWLTSETGGGVIRREDAAYWPQVQKKELTLQQALTLFDRIFDARQPASAH